MQGEGNRLAPGQIMALGALLLLAALLAVAWRQILALAYNNLGNIYMFRAYQGSQPLEQSARAAVPLFQDASRFWPADPAPKAALADALLLRGQYDRAGDLLRSIVPTHRLVERASAGMRYLAQAGRMEQSRQILNVLVQAFPHSGVPFMRFAEAVAGKAPWADVMEDYVRAAEAEPGSALAAGSYYAAAEISMQQGAAERTIAYLQGVLSIPESVSGPDTHLAALYWLGATYQDLGQNGHAAPYLSEAVAAAPRSADLQGYGRRAAARLCRISGTLLCAGGNR